MLSSEPKATSWLFLNSSSQTYFVVRNWGEVNQHIVLSGDQKFSTKLSLENLCHFFRVVGLGSEVKGVILAPWLHNNNDIVIKTVLFSLKICVPYAINCGIGDVIFGCKLIFAMPGCGCSGGHLEIESVLNDQRVGLSVRLRKHLLLFVCSRTICSICGDQEFSQKLVCDGRASGT